MKEEKANQIRSILPILISLILCAVLIGCSEQGKETSPQSSAPGLSQTETHTPVSSHEETSSAAKETKESVTTAAGEPQSTEASASVPDTTGEPATQAPLPPLEGPLVSGTYRVITQDTGGPVVRIPIVLIDTETSRFDLFTLTDRETSKGSGTLSYANGIYTMHFDGSDRTTDLSFNGKEITFLTKLYFGIAAYNYTDEQGNFLPFNAEPFELPEVREDGPFEPVLLHLPSGVFEVDISPLGIENVSSAPKDLRLYIDAPANTFCLYEAADPTVLKNTGHIVPAENGSYELIYDKTGFITPFTFGDDIITFTNYLYYGSSYLKNENYEFVPHTACLTSEEPPVIETTAP